MKIYHSLPVVDLTTAELNDLTNNILVIHDWYDTDRLNELIKYTQPKYILNMYYVDIEGGDKEKDLPIFSFPAVFLFYNRIFRSANLPEITDYNTFNFIINKKLIHRTLCIRLVEMFKLTDYTYTWSGLGRDYNMSDIITELDQLGTSSPLTEEQRQFLLAPIEIESKFFEMPESVNSTDSHVNYKSDNTYTWNNFLKNIFTSSAVSLITESHGHLKKAGFTEKTSYAILGLTFPIWVGGYNQAQGLKQLGFDVFEDIIDHSYQSYPTLIERCYYAIANNLEILSNKSLAHELRTKNINRLKANRDLLLGDHTEIENLKIAKNWPTELFEKWLPLHFELIHDSRQRPEASR